jgi:hypothetical protein
MIGRSFRSMKSAALWGFAVSATTARLVVMLVAIAGVYAVGGSGIDRMLEGVVPSSVGSAASVGTTLGYIGAILLASVVAIPIGLILQGGLTHLSDEVLAGRQARTSGGWSVGARRMGRVFLIELVVVLIGFALSLVSAIPLVVSIAGGAAIGASSGSGDFNPAPVVVGFCCGYLFFLILLVFTAMFLGAFGAIAIRYAIIGDRAAGDALGSAWKALRARWKNVFVFSLIQFGFGAVWVAAASIVAVPVQLATAAAQQEPTLRSMLAAYAINGPITAILAVPLIVFSFSMWTAFFRQITGLDAVDSLPPIYAPPGYEYPSESAAVGVQQPDVSHDMPLA